MGYMSQRRQRLTTRSTRRDAHRNREAILRIADEAFADGSDLVPLDEIARRAGLGRATVYRHFPDRYALAAAVATEYMDALYDAVDATMDGRRDFRGVLRWVLATQVSMRPLVTLMAELPVAEQRQYTTYLIAILTPAFDRAQADGLIRPDVRPADLAWIMKMLITATDVDALTGATAGVAGGDPHEAIDRIIDVILDGLFSPPQARTSGTTR
ncbi:Regulatory protein TetR [Frankia sp. AiPs1]